MKIDGMKLEVSADELCEHFKKRLAHHEAAVAHNAASPLILVSKDGQRDKTELQKLHKQQIRFLKFITTHMPEGDSFLLTMNECNQLMLLNDVTEYGVEETS